MKDVKFSELLIVFVHVFSRSLISLTFTCQYDIVIYVYKYYTNIVLYCNYEGNHFFFKLYLMIVKA